MCSSSLISSSNDISLVERVRPDEERVRVDEFALHPLDTREDVVERCLRIDEALVHHSTLVRLDDPTFARGEVDTRVQDGTDADQRRHDRGSGLAGAPLERCQPSRVDNDVVVDERHELGVDVPSARLRPSFGCTRWSVRTSVKSWIRACASRYRATSRGDPPSTTTSRYGSVVPASTLSRLRRATLNFSCGTIAIVVAGCSNGSSSRRFPVFYRVRQSSRRVGRGRGSRPPATPRRAP